MSYAYITPSVARIAHEQIMAWAADKGLPLNEEGTTLSFDGNHDLRFNQLLDDAGIAPYKLERLGFIEKVGDHPLRSGALNIYLVHLKKLEDFANGTAVTPPAPAPVPSPAP